MSDEFQTIENYEPEDHFLISDLEALKIISDPLRIQIMETMLGGPYTVKQVSEIMGIPATKLYYHFNLLEEHAFVRVISTRMVKGIVEKLYHLRAYHFGVDRSLFTGQKGLGEEGFDNFLGGLMGAVRADIIKSIHSGLIDVSQINSEGDEVKRRDFFLMRTLNQLPKERAQELYRKFEELAKEYNDCQSDEASDPVFGLMIAYYPTTRSIPGWLRAKKAELKKQKGAGGALPREQAPKDEGQPA
jgi:DNA-binding transcriptional ArsR family regulator